MAEFSGVDLHRLIAEQHADDPAHAKWLIGELDRILAKHLGIAVYERQVPIETDKPILQFLSFGPRDSESHIAATDPIQLAPIRRDPSGTWDLLGYYQGEPGSIEDGQGPTYAEDYLARHKAGQ